ncbi:MAG: HD domain-containing protein [Deltaproteobacteria bacterium]|nr:HD domain-containing protein [Deltaproteobacteria bacterium]
MSDSTESDGRTITLGRLLIARWMAVFKALGLYEWQHSGVRAAADRVLEVVALLDESGGEVQLAVRGDSIFVNSIRIREGGFSAVSYQSLERLLNLCDINTISMDAETPPNEIQVLAYLLRRITEGGSTADELARELEVRGVTSLVVTFAKGEKPQADMLEGKELQKRVYLGSIGVLKSVFHEAREKDRINSRRVKRVVQQLIESMETDPGYMLNLTSVKNYDEYTFNHSVNVSVLAVALARAVGLSRRQLCIVGQAGMLHDLGKLCIPKHVLNKKGRLTPDERLQVQTHPVEGFLSVASKQGVASDSIGVALGAYEHHLNIDGSGYPKVASARAIGLSSRILAIVDRYDAMTSARIYRTTPMAPPKALSILHQSQRTQTDQSLLRYFMNMLGCFPLGTVVRLSSGCIAIVVGRSTRDDVPHMPVVKLVLDEMGRPAPDDTIDLVSTLKDGEPLTVLEVLDAAEYGIEVLDYIL